MKKLVPIRVMVVPSAGPKFITDEVPYCKASGGLPEILRRLTEPAFPIRNIEKADDALPQWKEAIYCL